MIKMISPKFIKSLREQNNLSQEYVAEKLQVSRPSYALIENGKKELTLSQAKILADVFGITLDSLIDGKAVALSEVKLEKEIKEKPQSTMRVSVPQKNLKKFKEVLLYILEKVGSKPNVGQTVLYKLLYFIDFDYYEKFEEQLIGATYIKNHHGPTPVEFKKIVENMEESGELEAVKSKYFQYDQTKYLPRRSPNLSLLSGQEKEYIDEVLGRLSDKSAKALSDYSHGDIPWAVAELGQEINYEMVFYRSDAYSVATNEEL